MRAYLKGINAVFAAAALLALPLAAQQRDEHKGHRQVSLVAGSDNVVPLHDNLGKLHYEISTKVPQAQQYFDQGLRLSFGFNHAEAIASFKRATELDPSCAMCYWGIAWAAGPNINAPMDSAGAATATEAIKMATKLAAGGDARQQAFIRAMTFRYAGDPIGRRVQLDSAYANAMRNVVAQYPDDPQARTLFAEALQVLSPWNYWTGKTARPHTNEMIGNLTNVMQRFPDHPGACHFYIHAVEAAYPERAVDCAERLAKLMPGAGHVVHMPGHIYIRVGRYMDAIRANEHAVHADEGFISDRRPGVGAYTAVYYPHNYDFLAFAASMAGRKQQAIEAADKTAELIPDVLQGAPGFMQSFATRPSQFRVRFGMWDEILKLAEPTVSGPYAQAMWHYARGRAFVAKNNVSAAETELAFVRDAAADPRMKGLVVEFNAAAPVLRIARDVLDGRLAQLKGERDRAVVLLRTAAREEDGLTYGEPPEWSVPVRHVLGEVLLEQGRAAEAEKAFREDLERFPRNGWALNGLVQSLERQGLMDDAKSVRSQLRKAWKHADFQLTGK